MKALPRVYLAYRERAELLTEAQAQGIESLQKVLKMLHVADMAAAREGVLAGELPPAEDGSHDPRQVLMFEH